MSGQRYVHKEVEWESEISKNGDMITILSLYIFGAIIRKKTSKRYLNSLLMNEMMI